MSRGKYVGWGMMIFLLAMSVSAVNCYNCTNCTAEIAAAGVGDIIVMNNSMSTTSSCIDFGGADGVTLDCNSSTILGDGIDNGFFYTSYSENNTIENCVINNFSKAINFEYSHNLTLINLTLQNSEDGIYIRHSNYTSVENLISDTVSDPIYLYNTISHSIKDTYIANCTKALESYYTFNGTFRNITAIDVGIPIDMKRTGHTHYSDVHFFNVADEVIYFYPSNLGPNNLTNVTIDGKELVIYSDQYRGCSNKVIQINDTFKHVYLYGCDNTTVKDGNSSGIHLFWVNNSLISNISSTSLVEGFNIYRSNNNTFENLTATNNGDDGFYLEYSNYNTFNNINGSNNDYAGLWFSFFNDGNVVNNSIFYNNDVGMDTGDSFDIIVENVMIYYSSTDGVYGDTENYSFINVSIYNADNCMNILSKNATFEKMDIRNCNDGIVFLTDSANNTVFNSFFINNTNGLYLSNGDYVKNNLFFNNYFNNTVNVDSTNVNNTNTWNITKILGTNIIGGAYLGGNFWANPQGQGWSENCTSETDGLCDLPYTAAINNTDYLPLTYPIISNNFTLTVHVNSTIDIENASITIGLYNALTNSTGQMYMSLTKLLNYTINVIKSGYIAQDATLNLTSDMTINFTLTPQNGTLPNATIFTNNETTDLNYVEDLENVSNFTLATDDAKIEFNGTVNVSGLDIDSNINITHDVISINSSAIMNLNTTATLTFANVTCPVDVIYYSSVHTTNISTVYQNGSDCEAKGICSNIQCIGSILTFDVSHFSSFAVGLSSNLSIWDDTDTFSVNETDQMRFFANYTNNTIPINGTGIYCEIEFNLSGTWQDNDSMIFNDTSGLYEYNRSFTNSGSYVFQVFCNATGDGYGTLNTTDSFTISAVAAPPASGTVCSAGCEYNNITGALLAVNSTFSTLTLNGSERYEISGQTFTIDDITNSGAIHITGNDSVLDCNGSTLIGSENGRGIRIHNVNNLTMMNCNIQNYSTGILVYNTTNLTMQNVSADTNGFIGLYFSVVHDSYLIDLSAESNGYNEYPRGGGILIRSSSNNTFNSSISTDNRGYGVRSRDSSDNILDNFTVITGHPFSLSSIYLSNSFNNEILNSYTSSPKSSVGIQFNDSDSNVFRDSEVYNQSYAFFLVNSDSNVISGNYIHGNVQALRRSASSSNIIQNNTYNLVADKPLSGTLNVALQVNFTFNISNALNESETSCMLYLNDTWQRTVIGISDGNKNITDTLSSGYYSWRVSCNDSGNNYVSTSPRLLAVGDIAPCVVPQDGSVFNYGRTICTNQSPYNTSLVLNGSNMVLDCNGTAFENGNVAFEIVGENVTVQDCKISNYTTGILVTADGAILDELNISNCTDAVHITGDRNSVLDSNFIENNRSIYLNGADDNVSGSYFCNNLNPINSIVGHNIYQNTYCMESIAPLDNSLSMVNNVEFNFTVLDMINQSNCDLMVDGSSALNQVENNGNNTFSHVLANGTYSWYVNCSDTNDNTGQTQVSTLNVGYQNYSLNITPIFQNQSINITIRLYRGTVLAYEFNTSTSIANNVTYGTYDLEFSAFGRDIIVTFPSFNFTEDADYTIGIDSPSVSGYLRSYGVISNISSPATVSINYSGISVDEGYLRMYRCADWNFVNRSCNSTFSRLTVSQSTSLNILEASVTSFSAFGLYQAQRPDSGSSGSSGSSSSWFGNVDFDCSFTYQCEEGHVCINRVCVENPTCDDGIQNQGEFEMDCGGPCDPCASQLLVGTCSDGIMNQGEDEIDCGGPCDPCIDKLKALCHDGVQNQGELGVDCGGPCDTCAKLGIPPGTCFDGKKNGLETAVDCGGLCEECRVVEQPVGVLIDKDAKTSSRLFVMIIIGVVIGVIGFGFFLSREKIMTSYNEYVEHIRARDEEKVKLKNYISHVVKTGQSPEKIVRVLTNVGWPPEMVIKLINREIDRPQEEFFEFADDDDEEIDFFS